MKFPKLAGVGCLFFGLVMILHAGSDAVPPNTAKNLIGVWEYNNPEFLHTIEFTSDGKFCLHITAGDIDIQKVGTYKLQDNTTIITSIGKDSSTASTRRLKIKSLTEKDLVVENEKAEAKAYRRK